MTAQPVHACMCAHIQHTCVWLDARGTPWIVLCCDLSTSVYMVVCAWTYTSICVNSWIPCVISHINVLQAYQTSSQDSMAVLMQRRGSTIPLITSAVQVAQHDGGAMCFSSCNSAAGLALTTPIIPLWQGLVEPRATLL